MLWAVNVNLKEKMKQNIGYCNGQLCLNFNSNETGLTIAVNQNLEYSHRHQNHLHAIHPLGLLNIEDSIERMIIENSLTAY